jgi:hypothetical protein
MAAQHETAAEMPAGAGATTIAPTHPCALPASAEAVVAREPFSFSLPHSEGERLDTIDRNLRDLCAGCEGDGARDGGDPS